MTGRESLMDDPSYVSLRTELATIFGVPVLRDGETWNAAMLRQIADKLGGQLRQAEYVARLLKDADDALGNLVGRLQ